MKILITGANGQLGQALQTVLTGHELLPMDADVMDITDYAQVQAVLMQQGPDLVINAAAYTRVDDAETDIENAYRVNALGPRNLALVTAQLGVPLAQVSTDYVFDGSGERPWHEFDQTRPLSVYGKSKLAGEQEVRLLNPRHYIVRTAWLYHISGQNFLRTMYRLSRAHEQLQVVDDQRGSPTHADDLARGIARLLDTQAYGVYHMANAGDASWYELTCEFFRQMEIQTRVVPVTTDKFPRPAPRPGNSVLQTLQQPQILLPDWRQGLADLVKGLREGGAADWD